MNGVKSYFNRDDMMNDVKSYFIRNWNRDDLMNVDEIPVDVHTSLNKVLAIMTVSFFFRIHEFRFSEDFLAVYLTLFCAMLSSTLGSYWKKWLSAAWGQLTVVFYVASLILIYFTPPGRVKTRVLLTMLAACLFGASVNAFTNYLFKFEQPYVLRLLAGTTIGCGSFLYRVISTRERSQIYLGCVKYCLAIMLSAIGFIVLDSSHTAHRAIYMHVAQSLFMGYLVIYSQEILSDANIGDINFVNCTFNVFFHLPGILFHAARLYLQDAEIEHHGQN